MKNSTANPPCAVGVPAYASPDTLSRAGGQLPEFRLPEVTPGASGMYSRGGWELGKGHLELQLFF